MARQNRNRYPPFFNLSLLDVVCNALGAVIFLMFLSHWQASRVSHHLQATRGKLEKEQQALADLVEQLGHLENTLRQTQKQLSQTENKLQHTQQEHERSLRTVAQLMRDLGSERSQRSALETRLKALELQLDREKQQEQKLQMQIEHVEKNLQATRTQLDKVRQQLARQKEFAQRLEQQRMSLAAETFLLSQMLNNQVTHNNALVQTLERVQKERDQLAQQTTSLNKTLQSADQREKELSQTIVGLERALKQAQQQAEERGKAVADLSKRLEVLVQENRRLSDRLLLAHRETASVQEKLEAQLRQAEARFAGVDLTGRRVVILVDTSGSMGKRDLNTEDPAKWTYVCETVRHVLASMPQLEQFQLITFSSSVNYPLGHRRSWLQFDRVSSPRDVYAKLQAVQPSGGTNLHAAFEEAFRFRPAGLDTILLFSDGLPTEAPNLTPQEQSLGNVERERLLAPRLLEQIRLWNRPLATQQTPAQVRIHAIGFYYDSPNLGNFLWSLVRENRGSFVGMSRP